MAENPPSEQKNIVRRFECPKCKKMHVVKFPANFAENRDTYPFPFVYLHSSLEDLQDLLTILYIDRNLQIRGSDVFHVEGGDIFSEALTRKITEKLMDEIVALQSENSGLKEENQQLQSLLEKGNMANYIKVEAESIRKSLEMPSKVEPLFEMYADKQSVTEENVVENADVVNAAAQQSASGSNNMVENNSLDIDTAPSPIIVNPSGHNLSSPETIQDEISDLIEVNFESLIYSVSKIITLSFSKHWKVYEIKIAIGNQLNLIPTSFYLSYGGVLMDDSKSVEEYQIESGVTFCLIPNTSGG